MHELLNSESDEELELIVYEILVLKLQILAKEGDTVKAGTQLARVAVGEAGAPAASPSKESAPPPQDEVTKSAPPLPPKTAPPSSSSPNKDSPPPQSKAPPPPPPSPAQPKSTSGTEVHMPTKGGERRVSLSTSHLL